MADLPLVSIVTPSFNSADFVARAIDSVLAQDYVRFEHIVVDGDSTDGTVDILRRYPHLMWVSEPDSGQSDALNKGFRMARGEIVGWLNADDRYAPGAVPRAARYLAEHPDCDLVYGDCNVLDEDGRLVRVFRSRPVDGVEKLLAGVIHTPAVFWRRRLFEQVGYLDEELHYVLDNEFWLRMAPIVRQTYLPGPMALFYLQPGSKTESRSAEFAPETCRIYEAVFTKEPWASQVPEGTKSRLLAGHYWSGGVALCRSGRADRARSYLRTAIDRYDVLDRPTIMIERLVVQYSTGRARPIDEVMETVSSLPISGAEKKCVAGIVRQCYWLTRFFAAKNTGDGRKIGRAGLDVVVRQPGQLFNRGFASIWGTSLLGNRLSSLLRRLI